MNSTCSHGRISATILRRLARKHKWGHSHTAFENLIGGIPSNERGEARKAAEELVREGFIRIKPTFYGKQVSLNENRCDEIKALIRRHFGNAAPD